MELQLAKEQHETNQEGKHPTAASGGITSGLQAKIPKLVITQFDGT